MSEVIDLCTSSDDDEDVMVSSLVAARENTNQQLPTVKAAGKRKIEMVEDNEEEDDECMIVQAPPQVVMTGAASSSNAAASSSSSTDAAAACDDDDDDVQYEGRTGALALADFPHSRENCATKPFKPGFEDQFCENCYCYCCDKPAKGCTQWVHHCKAVHSQPFWQQRRRECAAAAAAGTSADGSSSSTPSSSSVTTVASNSFAAAAAAATHALNSGSWTCQRVVKALEQVYPVEPREPKGFRAGAALRPYQRQSLGFMLDIERSTDASLRGDASGDRGRFCGSRAAKALDGQSVLAPRGGWLCDEVGMGKTVVVAALVLSNPSPSRTKQTSALAEFTRRDLGSRGMGRQNDWTQPTRIIQAWKSELQTVEKHVFDPEKKKYEFKEVREHVDVRDYANDKNNPEWVAWTKPPSRVDVHATLIVAPTSLTGQWVDELAKFAPTLKVVIFEQKTKKEVIKGIKDIDVLLMTPGTGWPDERFRALHWRRIVLDESHSDYYKNSQGAKFLQYQSEFLWCVTGTPLSSALSDLESCAILLGHWNTGLRLCQYESCKAKWGTSLVPVLKKLMIRHSKGQRVHGEEALALPASKCQTVWLDMGPQQKAKYDALPKPQLRVAREGCKVTKLELALATVAQACSVPEYVRPAKMQALLEDLHALKRTEPEMHAVVFTHHVCAYDVIKSRLSENGFSVCGFSGSTAPKDRHATIRSFQESVEARKPGISKVFVATMKVGNVGITLTAATRVYLMEPCLDPMMEVQAAGRIHRLGQTRDVLVKRYAYRNSLDASVIKLHGEIEAGRIAISDNVFPPEAVRILLGQ